MGFTYSIISLVFSVAFMWFSGKIGGNFMQWHLRAGLLLIALIVFRIVWGVIGSDTARFTQFVAGPAKIKRYLNGQLTESEQLGHNPLGVLMALFLLISLQLLTGFASDEKHGFIMAT